MAGRDDARELGFAGTLCAADRRVCPRSEVRPEKLDRVVVVVGTLLGKRLLGRLSPTRFVTIARVLMVLIVLHIVATELYSLVA